MWQCGIVALWRFRGCTKIPSQIEEGLSPPLGEEGRGLVLTQIVHNAVHLTGSECALLARVAQLSEFVFERLANVDPVL